MSKRAAKESMPSFPIGPAAKRELRRALVRTTDPAATIQEFQQTHSLHAMMARGFGTTPRYAADEEKKGNVESLDTDSVMMFLSHLGLSQFEVHKRISDTLLKQLDEEIRRHRSDKPLLDLLKNCWPYVVPNPELRPVLWSVLKQLGERTPLTVLKALAERDKKAGELKHADIFRSLTPLLKRLCWEADWDSRMPQELSDTASDKFLETSQSTLLYETLAPHLKEYVENPVLVTASNLPFVASKSERRLLTTQRRALTTSLSTATATTTASLLKTSASTKPSTPKNPLSSAGKAVASFKSLLSDATTGSATVYRPKLLYALLSTLIARHGTAPKSGDALLGGSEFLHCTLVADILLSAGGSLPKEYNDVLVLAGILDECVQEGNVSNDNLIKLQGSLSSIFQTDLGEDSDEKSKKEEKNQGTADFATSNAMKRQLNRLITSGLNALKENDPQNLYMNPVTDGVAPGYSKIIKEPMCISTMEKKVAKNEYISLSMWESDVKLMFKNCVDYNRGNAGKWFRGEAQRQGKVFREEIFTQAKAYYQTEIDKKLAAARQEEENRKRKAEEAASGVHPLAASLKKRKRDKDSFPSMPALASMLVADPFVVRVLLARVLRDLRMDVLGKSSLPSVHNAVPSILQLLQMARWSSRICSVRGKRFFVPDVGLRSPVKAEADDESFSVAPFTALRNVLPLILCAMLEEEFDRRTTANGDLHDASQAASEPLSAPSLSAWKSIAKDDVAVATAVLQGALVRLCQPGEGNEASLSITFPKYARILGTLAASSLWKDRAFFRSLVRMLLRHRSKLPKEGRDAVIQAWLSWLKKEDDTGVEVVASAAHENLVRLLNDWSALGNLLLPRDMLVEFCTDVVRVVNGTEGGEQRKFSSMWNDDEESGFKPIKTQYERMLKQLPPTQAAEWKASVGITEPMENDIEDMDAEEKIDPAES